MEQTILKNITIIVQLAIIEGLLSFDNALALAALVNKKLKNEKMQKRALIWGLWGAYIMRTGIIFIGVWLMKYEWIKALAGIYLIYLAVHELCFQKKEPSLNAETNSKTMHINNRQTMRKLFWMTIVQVELMDLMFSVDSIAVALAVSDIKWVLISGAILGILLMRVAAQFFIRLIKRFPILEKTAFVMVGVAGINVILKLKGLNLGFMSLSIDKPIPEHLFLGLMLFILVASFFVNGLIYKSKLEKGE